MMQVAFEDLRLDVQLAHTYVRAIRTTYVPA